MIATSTRVDLGTGLDLSKFNDDYFKKPKEAPKKKSEEEFFAKQETKQEISPQRKDDQKAVDGPLLEIIKKTPLLKQYLKGQLNADPQGYEEKCRHASEREGVAAEAERASVQYKRVELVQTLQGTVLEGVISSITDWGIYVELVDNYCEGMVRLADMRDDYYRLDEKHFRIIGKRTKKAYHLGDQVRVQIKSCDLSTRTVSLVFAS